MSEKIYAPIKRCEEVSSRFGPFLKLQFSAEKFIAFINEHKNDRGYVNLTVNKRREPGEYGDTHYVTLDTFVPDASKRRAGSDNANPNPTSTAKPEPPEQGDVPF